MIWRAIPQFLFLGLYCVGVVHAHPNMPLPAGSEALSGLIAEATPMLAYTPQQLYDLVPPGSGIIFCGCPNCNGGAQEYYEVVWSPGMGESVRCTNCGVVLPNAQYPNNGQISITSPQGVQQVYPYYQDGTGKRYFFQARAWYDRGSWLMRQAQVMANVYALNGDTTYGDRAAAIVGRHAFLYKEYPNRYDYPFRNLTFYPAYSIYPFSENGDHRPCKLYHWSYGDIPEEVIRAYDMLAGGDAMQRMAGLIGSGIESRMRNDVIRWSFESVRAWPETYDNMMPYTYSTMVVAGRVGEFPDMVHHAVDQARTLMNVNFTQDGWWNEGAPSYHAQVVSSMDRLIQVCQGYNDPSGYAGSPFVNLDLAAQIPQLGRARAVMEEGVLPDGRMIPINDTWWYDHRTARTSSPSTLWPGLGHAFLGSGQGAAQFQLHLNWSGNYGHSHYDNGGILLWSFGKEMLSDIGYTNTTLRPFATSTAAHNTVQIDTVSQRYGSKADPATGNARWFDAQHPHVRWMDLDGRPAYANATEYRRRLLQVHINDQQNYVIDLFDVAGGTTHDYLLHGSADEQGTFVANVPLTPTSNQTAIAQAYPNFSQWQSWVSDGTPIETTWTYGQVNLRTHLFHTGSTSFHTFLSPAIRPANENEGAVLSFFRRGLLLRHAAGSSRFAVLHEPYQNSPFIVSASVDTNWNTRTTSFSVQREGGTERIWLMPERVRVTSSQGWDYDSGLPHQATVSSFVRGTTFSLMLDSPMPVNIQAVRLQFGTGRSLVVRVRNSAGNRVELAEDPGFSYDAQAQRATWLFFPQQTQDGPLRAVAYDPTSGATDVPAFASYQ